MKQTVKADKKTLEARVIKTDELLSTFMGCMTNPDEILRDAGEAQEIYRYMKTDSRIKSLLTVAKSAVLNYPLRIEQGEASDDVNAFIEESIKPKLLLGAAKRLLTGMDYGYSVLEIVWKEQKGTWIPDDIVLRKPERFSCDTEGRLLHKKLGEIIQLYEQSYKWLVYRHDKDAENPYGTSILKSCYWPWKFKKAGLEFWLMAAEKFAVPSILALFESSETDEKLRDRAMQLSEMLSTVQSGSGAALANIKDIKVLESPGSLSEFKTLMDWCDTQIAYGIVYQSLAVQEAQNGTRAQAEVHEDTFQIASKNVCREIADVLQRIIDWTVELNYGLDVPAPSIAFEMEEHAAWEVVRDAIDRGVPISKTTLYDRYGLPEPKDEQDVFLKTESTQANAFMADTEKKKTRRSILLR